LFMAFNGRVAAQIDLTQFELTLEDVGPEYELDTRFSGPSASADIRALNSFYNRLPDISVIETGDGLRGVGSVVVTTGDGPSVFVLELLMQGIADAAQDTFAFTPVEGPAVGESTQWYEGTWESDNTGMRVDAVRFIAGDVGFIVITVGIDGLAGPHETARYAQTLAERALEIAAQL